MQLTQLERGQVPGTTTQYRVPGSNVRYSTSPVANVPYIITVEMYCTGTGTVTFIKVPVLRKVAEPSFSRSDPDFICHAAEIGSRQKSPALV